MVVAQRVIDQMVPELLTLPGVFGRVLRGAACAQKKDQVPVHAELQYTTARHHCQPLQNSLATDPGRRLSTARFIVNPLRLSMM